MSSLSADPQPAPPPLQATPSQAGGGSPAGSSELGEDRDAAELSRLGYAQELFREMGGYSNFALSFSMISIVTGITQLYDYGLKMGGPFEMLAGWPIVCFFTAFVGLSLAELASAYPTSGAMYHWSCRLGGAGWGWVTAWLNLLGLVTVAAAVDYGCAQFLAPLLGLKASTNQLLALYALILISHGLINHLGIRLVAWLNDFSVTMHILAVLALVGALAAWAPHHELGFLLTQVSTPDEPRTVPTSYALAFVVGLLQAQWTMTGYDASAQVSEETHDPRRHVPWGIVMAIAISAVFGYMFVLALTLSVDTLDGALGAKDAGGNAIPAVIAILTHALGSRAGTMVAALATATMWFCGLSCVTSVSRACYAFARDGGLPASDQLRQVGPRSKTPAKAIWTCVALAYVAMVYAQAQPIITSISVVALYLSYISPVYLAWRNHRRGEPIERGPWHLGGWSQAIRGVALIWVVWIAVVLVLPPNQLTGQTLAGTLVGLGVLWKARDQGRFVGPRFTHADGASA
jgi:amino acid transporter